MYSSHMIGQSVHYKSVSSDPGSPCQAATITAVHGSGPYPLVNLAILEDDRGKQGMRWETSVYHVSAAPDRCSGWHTMGIECESYATAKV